MYQSHDQRTFARNLRSNQTDAEKKLWSCLRKRQLCNCRFRRQYAIGPFVVDFECFERRVIIELDGGQHNTDAARSYDDSRSRYLQEHGYVVLRYWNHEVIEETDEVLQAIARVLGGRASLDPHPGPPPEGEGE